MSIFSGNNTALAQTTIPAPADAGRIQIEPDDILPPVSSSNIEIPESERTDTPAPENADTILFTLENVEIKGMSVFTRDEISDVYQNDLGQQIPLSKIWEYADKITSRYKNEGYFLSRAYIPAQEIDGVISINVVEGYIGEVEIDGERESNYLIEMLKKRITEQRPSHLQDLENTLLLFSDIPGKSFESILSKMDSNAPEGAVRLTLTKQETKGRGAFLFNNHGARFTGPHRASFAYENSFIPNHNTAISGLASLPGGNELWAVSATHSIKILPEVGINLSAGHTVSEPGYTLSSLDIESRSTNWGIGIDWQIVRQRQHNIKIGASLDARNVNTDILDTPLTRDRIRAVRLSTAYNGNDKFKGYNDFNLVLSHGLSGLGASNPNDPNLSRADAEPDFTKLELYWQRSQFLSSDWLGITTILGQYASKALYSSEEIGFGGPSLGRAYDASEITGDHGIGGSVELHYTGLNPVKRFQFKPFTFLEGGNVWNIDDGQDKSISLMNAGLGLDISHPSGVSARFSIAQPLTKSIDTPTYGNNGHNPRVYFQLSYSF